MSNFAKSLVTKDLTSSSSSASRDSYLIDCESQRAFAVRITSFKCLHICNCHFFHHDASNKLLDQEGRHH